MTPVLARAHPVTLIGGGEATAADLRLALSVAPALVAADGGADAALALGYCPDAVIGDMDSLSDAARTAIPAGRLHKVAEQDSTDFEKCVTRIAAPLVLAVGFTGRRVDHLLACLTTLVRVGAPCILIGPDEAIMAGPPRLRLDLSPGTRVSLYPLGRVKGTSRGLRWPIDGLVLDPAGRVGTSNETTAELGGAAELTLDGPCILMVPRANLPAAMRALSGP